MNLPQNHVEPWALAGGAILGMLEIKGAEATMKKGVVRSMV